MGLLDRFDKKKQDMEIPEYVNLQYESMTDETRAEIVRYFKRLFIRGTLGKQEEYSAVSNICVRDGINNVICYSQGSTEDQKIYGLIIKDEMWCVTAVVDTNDINGEYKDVEVIYIPSKIGKVSKVDDKVLSIAEMAVDMLEGEKRTEYIESLKGFLSEESVLEYIQMEKSWYEQIFEDENCRQLRDYQVSKIQVKESVEKPVVFGYELVEELELVAYKSMLKGKIKGKNYVFNPKMCVKADNDNIRCFKYMKNIDFSNLKDTQYKEALYNNVQYNDIQYYVLFINGDIVLVGAVETPDSGDISIEKITTFGLGEYNMEALQNMASNAILKIQQIWYNKPSVNCANQVHTEKCTYDKQVEI